MIAATLSLAPVTAPVIPTPPAEGATGGASPFGAVLASLSPIVPVASAGTVIPADPAVPNEMIASPPPPIALSPTITPTIVSPVTDDASASADADAPLLSDESGSDEDATADTAGDEGDAAPVASVTPLIVPGVAVPLSADFATIATSASAQRSITMAGMAIARDRSAQSEGASGAATSAAPPAVAQSDAAALPVARSIAPTDAASAATASAGARALDPASPPTINTVAPPVPASAMRATMPVASLPLATEVPGIVASATPLMAGAAGPAVSATTLFTSAVSPATNSLDNGATPDGLTRVAATPTADVSLPGARMPGAEAAHMTTIALTPSPRSDLPTVAPDTAAPQVTGVVRAAAEPQPAPTVAMAADQGAGVTGIDLDAIFPAGSNAPLNVAFVRQPVVARSAPARLNVATPDVASPVDQASGADATPAIDPTIVTNPAFGMQAQSASAVQGDASTVGTVAAPAEIAMQHHLDMARDGAWLDRLAHDIAASADKDSRMRFQLNPERLGALSVEIRQQSDGALVRFSAESEVARSMIADAQPQLVAEARAQGMRIADTQVDLGGQNGSSGGSLQSGSGGSFAQQQNQQAAQQPQRSFDRPGMTQSAPSRPAERGASRSAERYA